MQCVGIYFCESSATLNEAKLQQKLRVRSNGINAIALAAGQKVSQEDILLKVWDQQTMLLMICTILIIYLFVPCR